MAMAPERLSPLAGSAGQPFSTVVLAFSYGAALLAIGVATVALGEVAHWTALIPAMMGVLVLLVAAGGRFGGLGERIVGGAVLALSAVALMGTLSALPMLPAALTGGDGVRNAAAVFARSATAVASVLYVVAMAVLIVRRLRDRRARA
jgi:hypothetical protein